MTLRLIFLAIAAFVLVLPASARDPISTARPEAPPEALDAANSDVLRSTGTSRDANAKTLTDAFFLYGATGSNEGTFETPSGVPDWQGWTSVDISEQSDTIWQVSTFNAETLGGHGVGNHAVWCGQDALQQPGWVDAPGYGNNWNQVLVWESPPLVDPSIAQNVSLDFFFHHQSEPGYDFFSVEYDSAGSTPIGSVYYGSGPGSLPVMNIDGTDYDWGTSSFPAPGVTFSDAKFRELSYGGNDYGEPGEDVIRIKLRFRSDGAWSDEDGLFPSVAGAVQVDDIRVRWDDGTGVIRESFEDFEGIDPLDNGEWRWELAPFAGDFASVLPGLTDLDPCVENRSPVVVFIDYGQEINNAASAAYSPGTPTSTGGSLSPNWSYGTSGGWVTNYTGGVSGDVVPLFNQVWSPPIDWDLPGTSDDGPDMRGGLLEFDVYEHLPVVNANFWQWHVRSRSAGGAWSVWRDRNFVYYGDRRWTRRHLEVGDLLVDDVDQVQIALGVWDMAAIFGFPGNDATPSPYFDNVSLQKHRVTGPYVSTRERYLARDSFANSGAIDASTQTGRDALDIRFDMVQDLAANSQGLIVPGDSVTVDVVPVLPGSAITDVRMLWVLDRNPLFDDVRVPPARPGLDVNVDTQHGLNQWSGEVMGSMSHSGPSERWFFDLPDEDFLHPGDVLRYSFRAMDDGGGTTTLPEDASGLDDGVNFDVRYQVRCLPTIADVTGDQPKVLLIDQTNTPAEKIVQDRVLTELGMVRGVDYDVYRRRTPTLSMSNGIGAEGSGGASIDQVAGYEVLFLHATNTQEPLGEGADWGDKSKDVQLLTAWHELPGDRGMLYVGDELVANLQRQTLGYAYIEGVMGASPTGGTNFASAVEAGHVFTLDSTGTPFPPTPSLGINMGCLPSEFEVTSANAGLSTLSRWFQWMPVNDVMPLTMAYTGHRVLLDGYLPLDGVAATIVHDRIDGLGDRKVDVTLTVPLEQLITTAKTPVGPSARSTLVRDLLTFVGAPFYYSPVVDAPATVKNRLAVAPNPFNPRTEVFLTLATSAKASVKVYDVRGREVRTLHDGVLEGGVEHRLAWDGRDARGQSLASGVYFISVDSPEFQRRHKVALIK